MAISKTNYEEILRRDREFWYVTGAWWGGWAVGVFSGWLLTYAWFFLYS